MANTVSITSAQLDQANFSLDRATAILEVLSDCGSGYSERDEDPTKSVFVVIDIAREELSKVRRALNSWDDELQQEIK